MSDAQEYLLVVDHDKAEASRIATRTSEKLESRQTNLLDVVQSLGEFINDEDAKIRESAVSYLTAVLSALNPKFLSRQQIQVLCQFYCDRIEDGSGAMEGLSKLQALDRFNNDMAQMTARAVLQNFQDLQTRPQSSRFQILSLVNDIMSRQRKALRDMGDESLVGIVDLVSGEKDPRNLMLIFSMVRVLMLEWDITNYAETLFDAVYAYFPITFRPPPNDPYGITAQNLKDRLRDCIASTHHMAPYSIPNLLDKLDSTSTNVKRDVLRTLTACAETYDARTISQYSIPLWDSLKFEILSAQEPELAAEALTMLKAIATKLSVSVEHATPTSYLAQYLRPITTECNEHIQEPAQRQAKASGDVLFSLSSPSPAAYTLITKAVFPPLFVVYQDVGAIMKQRALQEIMNLLLDSCIEVFGTWHSAASQATADIPLEPFKDKLLETYSQALMGTVKEEVSFRMTAAKGLLRLSKIRGFLQDNEIGLIVQHLNDIVLKEEAYGRDELKRTAMESLADISRYKPRPIMDITFPAFMAELPDNDGTAESTRKYITTLEGLAEISVEKEPFETLVRRLLNKIDVLLQTNNLETPAYSRAILSTILYTMERRGLKGDLNILHYYDRIVKGLIQRAVSADTTKRSALSDESVQDVLGRLGNVVVRNLPIDKHLEVAEMISRLSAVETGQARGLSTLMSDPNHVAKIVLSTWLLAALPRDIQAPGFTVEGITFQLQDLASLATVHTRQEQSSMLAILRQIALYINKHLPQKELSIVDTTIASTYAALPTVENATSRPIDPDQGLDTHRVYLIFVITKALLLRLAPSTTSHVQRLLTLLSPTIYPERISRSAALAFRTLLIPDPVLSATNGFIMRKLAAQRLFTTLIPSISTSFRAASSFSEKENYLTALSGILGTVPKEVVMPELPILLPLLLQSLDLADQAVKLATLQTMQVVVTENCGALIESGHVDALVKRLVKIATSAPEHKAQDSDTMMTDSSAASNVNAPASRRSATHLLVLFPPAITKASSTEASKVASTANPLLSLKKEVLRSLMKVLDDPRRDVRKEAVDARAAWLRGVDEADDEESD